MRTLPDLLQAGKRQRLSEEAPAAAAPAAALAAPEAEGDAASGAPTKLVIIWDLDETLLTFNSLLTGAFALATRQPEAADRLRLLGARWERAILSMCDDRFFFGEVRLRCPAAGLPAPAWRPARWVAHVAGMPAGRCARSRDGTHPPCFHLACIPPPHHPQQLEEYDQTCLADIQRHDDGASLAGYDFAADGFPPPPPEGGASQRSTPEKHAAAARPAPEPPVTAEAATGAAATDAAAAAGGGVDSGQAEPAGQAAAAQPPGSPAAGTCHLDAAALTKLSYRFRRIVKLCTFGLAALGSAAQRREWEVRRPLAVCLGGPSETMGAQQQGMHAGGRGCCSDAAGMQ